MPSFAHALLLGAVAALAAVRVLELGIDRIHEARLRARGGYRVGRDALGFLVAGQVLLLSGALVEGVLLPPHPAVTALTWSFLGLALAALALRHWCIATLGDHWTIRIVIVPGARLVTRGPYRFLHHPNYWAVATEFATFCFAFQLWWTLALVAAVSVPALLWRIRREDQALAPFRGPGHDATGPRQTT